MDSRIIPVITLCLSQVCVLNCFSSVQLFVTLWTIACQAPLSMDFSGKNTGVGCHFFLEGIFLTQESNLCLLYRQADSLPLNHQGSPMHAGLTQTKK